MFNLNDEVVVQTFIGSNVTPRLSIRYEIGFIVDIVPNGRYPTYSIKLVSGEVRDCIASFACFNCDSLYKLLYF